MALRRFPWELAHQSDPSFKLFVTLTEPHSSAAENTPNESPESLFSQLGIKEPPSVSVHEISPSDSPRRDSGVAVSTKSSLDESILSKDLKDLPGPARLLRRLPAESRAVIRGMLDINPATRTTIRQILKDSWIKNVDPCSQHKDGTIHRGSGHQHTLQRD
jgi:serine/threonine protein kinase